MNNAPTASERICRFAEEIRFEDIPPEVIEKAKLLTLDVLGIARADPIDMPLRAAARALAGKGEKTAAESDYGHCSAVGEKNRMPAASAAFLNGALGHSLDFDDTHTKSVVHTAAPIIPPALAGAEAFRKGLARHRGTWEVCTWPTAARAIAFWRKTLRTCVEGELQETEEDHAWGRRVVFRFDNRVE